MAHLLVRLQTSPTHYGVLSAQERLRTAGQRMMVESRAMIEWLGFHHNLTRLAKQYYSHVTDEILMPEDK